MSGVSKANQRQHVKRAARYKAQQDITPLNKIITMARHAIDHSDKTTIGKLKSMPKINLTRAAHRSKSERITAFLHDLAK